MKLKIDEELKNLIPPLSDEEFKQLEDNILAEGIREPLVVWNGTIIDGHNRYNIAEKHGLNFAVKEMSFADKNAAINWMIYNQFGRRNLSVYDRVCLALKLKSSLTTKAKENSLANLAPNVEKQNFACREYGGNVNDQIAKIAGVSRETARKVEKIQKLAAEVNNSDEIIRHLRTGNISISLALDVLEMRKEKLNNLAREIKIHLAIFRERNSLLRKDYNQLRKMLENDSITQKQMDEAFQTVQDIGFKNTAGFLKYLDAMDKLVPNEIPLDGIDLKNTAEYKEFLAECEKVRKSA